MGPGALLLLLGALLQAAAQPTTTGGRWEEGPIPMGRSQQQSCRAPWSAFPLAGQRWKLVQPQRGSQAAAAPQPAAAPASALAAGPASAGGQVLISELMVSNKQTVKDEDGTSPDWLELYNRGPGAVSLSVRGLAGGGAFEGGWCLWGCGIAGPPWTVQLPSNITTQSSQPSPPAPPCPRHHNRKQGYKLTDHRDGSDAWAFPPGASLAAGQYLLVFASGKSRAAPGKPLHTSCKLSADDGYLALLGPGGEPTSELQFPE